MRTQKVRQSPRRIRSDPIGSAINSRTVRQKVRQNSSFVCENFKNVGGQLADNCPPRTKIRRWRTVVRQKFRGHVRQIFCPPEYDIKGSVGRQCPPLADKCPRLSATRGQMSAARGQITPTCEQMSAAGEQMSAACEQMSAARGQTCPPLADKCGLVPLFSAD